MSFVEELLKNLIEIPSPSESEIKICNYIFELLEKNDFTVKKQPVDQNGFNIIASKGTPSLYLSAHMDTVLPLIKFREDQNFIYGRGACDTKGSLVSMIAAGIKCKKEGFDNFGLIFTVGEETNFRGAIKIIDSEIKIPFIVVGEPTSLKIVNGHYGILVIKIVTQGKAAHSSYPQKGINAIDDLLPIISQIKQIKTHPQSLMSLVMINGGKADNIIPDRAEAVFSFRISPDDQNDYLGIIAGLLGKKAVIQKEIDIKSVYSPVPPQLSFINERSVVKYCTELSFFKKGIVLGPGDIQYAHANDEKIAKKELAEAVETYSQIIKNFNKK